MSSVYILAVGIYIDLGRSEEACVNRRELDIECVYGIVIVMGSTCTKFNQILGPSESERGVGKSYSTHVRPKVKDPRESSKTFISEWGKTLAF